MNAIAFLLSGVITLLLPNLDKNLIVIHQMTHYLAEGTKKRLEHRFKF